MNKNVAYSYTYCVAYNVANGVTNSLTNTVTISVTEVGQKCANQCDEKCDKSVMEFYQSTTYNIFNFHHWSKLKIFCQLMIRLNPDVLLELVELK